MSEDYILNIDENGEKEKVPYSPLLDIMGEEIYKKFKDAEIENSKNKFLNFMSHLVEVESEEDADNYLIIHKDAPNIFDYKEINKEKPEVKSPDKKIFYLKKVDKKRRRQRKRF